MRLKLATFNLHNFGREDNPSVFEQKLGYVMDVLRALDPDVVALNEVRETEAFEELAGALSGYGTRFLGDPPAERRRIQTAILSRLNVTAQGQWHEYSAVLPDRPTELQKLRFCRPIPWLRLELHGGKRLFVCAVHLKSWRAGSEEMPPETSVRLRQVVGRSYAVATRNSEAAGLRLLLDGMIDGDAADHFAVLGDLNDRLDSSAAEIVAGLESEDPSEPAVSESRRLYPAGWWMPERRAFSYVRHGRRELFDHIFVSRGLSLRLVRAAAESQLLEPVHVRRPEPAGGFPRSDHAPVWAEFDLPG